jgi:hypothetical protein
MNIGKRMLFMLATMIALLAIQNVSNAQDSLFTPPLHYAAGDLPAKLFVADYNGDGYKDIAIPAQNSDSVGIMLNYGDGTFQPKISYAAGNAPVMCFASDLDGDFDFDMVVANQLSDNISIHLNNGNGSFLAPTTYTTGDNPTIIFIDDFDGDQDNDIAVTTRYSNVFSIFKNNGNGTFQARVNYSTPSGPWGMAGADIDNDSDIDLVVANRDAGSVSIFENNGDGTFRAPFSYSTGTGSQPVDIAISDFNEDGFPDFACSGYGVNNISVFLNNRNHTFGPLINYSIPDGPFGLYSADFDGDNHIDLAVSRSSTSYFSILKGDGSGAFGSPIHYNTGYVNNGFPFPADIDDDGTIDVIVTNGNSDIISVFINRTLDSFQLVQPTNQNIINQTSITFIWIESQGSNPSYQVYYKLYWDDQNDFSSSDSVVGLTDTSYTITGGLNRSTRYYWRVYAYDLNNDPPRFSEQTFSFYLDGYPTSPAIINPPIGAFVDSMTYLTWLIGTDPDSFDMVSYEIQIDNDSLFNSPEINDTIPSGVLLDNSISVRIRQLENYTNLQNDSKYYWRVRSLDNYGLTSPWPDTLHWVIYNHLNHPPLPPTSGFSPANSEEVISLNPTITWNNASDPDPDDNPGTLHYILRLFSDTSTGGGYEYWDTTAPGVNQVVVADTMPDNCLWIYMVQTVDDEGLSSGWTPMQHFWTNHYNYPPEPFPLYSPDNDIRHVAAHITFTWGRTVDYDPLASYTYAFRYSADSLFGSGTRTIYGIADTFLTMITDTLYTVDDIIYWGSVAIDDDSLIRIGGIPEQTRRLEIFPPGDANTDHSVLGGDVTFLVRYFKGLGNPPDPFYAGDANGDCQLQGSDVTFLVRYFKGIGPAPERRDCE